MASILLVNDDDEFLAMLSEVLQHAGYEIGQTSDGEQAINLYRMHPTDLVITDLVLPKNEGIQLIVELRRLNHEVKIIAISGADLQDEYLEIATALGVKRVLAKPFSDDEILKAISEVLEGTG
jgi:DNA-binding response OmpR family regulator